MSARIVGLADLYDVCCSPTVYRPQPLGAAVTTVLVESLASTKFDPVVVAAFRRCRTAFAEITARGSS